MQKLLLLGGSPQQIIAIETAKRMGLYTVLCDYLPDNPGKEYADKFYLVSTTDRESILKVAEQEQVSAILAYASDPAAPTAAYVAEKLGLPTNPLESVEILCNKDKFRQFLHKKRFSVPRAAGFSNNKDAIEFTLQIGFPVIVKPVDSSGSKGVTVVWKREEIGSALKHAFSVSRSGRIVIEQYIQKKHKLMIGGDIFVLDGKIALWGLLNCHRDELVNELVPVGKSYPLMLPVEELERCKLTLQHLVDCLHISNGAMNVELIVGEDNGVYLIDVGPRNGGNMIPNLLGMIYGIDIIEMTIRCALGEQIKLPNDITPNCYMATHNLHTNKNGHFCSVNFAEEIQKHIVKCCMYKTTNDEVHYFDNSAQALGIVFLKFDSERQLGDMMENINSYIDITVTE